MSVSEFFAFFPLLGRKINAGLEHVCKTFGSLKSRGVERLTGWEVAALLSPISQGWQRFVHVHNTIFQTTRRASGVGGGG